jgi:hypothetical protein
MLLPLSFPAIMTSQVGYSSGEISFQQGNGFSGASTADTAIMSENPSDFSSDVVLSYPQSKISTAEPSYQRDTLLILEDYSRLLDIYRYLMINSDEDEEEIAKQIEKDLKRPDYPEFIRYLFNHNSDEFKSLFIRTWLADGPDIFNSAYYTALKICQRSSSKELVSISSEILKLYSKHFEGLKECM